MTFKKDWKKLSLFEKSYLIINSSFILIIIIYGLFFKIFKI
jgi:hypothetical protein